MDTNKPILAKSEAFSSDVQYEYSHAEIVKTDSDNTYGIAVQDVAHDDVLCVKEIGRDKELVLSLVDTLNHYRVPYVHFLDVIHDLMNG